MLSRSIDLSEIEEVLANIQSHTGTPEQSTRIEGSTAAGRTLKIWIVGTKWPPDEPVVLKSVAERGVSD